MTRPSHGRAPCALAALTLGLQALMTGAHGASSPSGLTFTTYIADVREHLSVNASYERQLSTAFYSFDLDDSGFLDAQEVQLAQNRHVNRSAVGDSGGCLTNWLSANCAGSPENHVCYSPGKCFLACLGCPYNECHGSPASSCCAQFLDIFCLIKTGGPGCVPNHKCMPGTVIKGIGSYKYDTPSPPPPPPPPSPPPPPPPPGPPPPTYACNKTTWSCYPSTTGSSAQSCAAACKKPPPPPQPPSGHYAGSSKVCAAGVCPETMTFQGFAYNDSTFDMQIHASGTVGVDVNCKHEKYAIASDGTVTLPNSGKPGDCIHDNLQRLQNLQVRINSIKFDASKNTVAVSIHVHYIIDIDVNVVASHQNGPPRPRTHGHAKFAQSANVAKRSAPRQIPPQSPVHA
eukprot:COSAG01_NODE_1257_length_11020_cov_5.619723_6_plen_401_part_00